MDQVLVELLAVLTEMRDINRELLAAIEEMRQTQQDTKPVESRKSVGV